MNQRFTFLDGEHVEKCFSFKMKNKKTALELCAFRTAGLEFSGTVAPPLNDIGWAWFQVLGMNDNVFLYGRMLPKWQ